MLSLQMKKMHQAIGKQVQPYGDFQFIALVCIIKAYTNKNITIMKKFFIVLITGMMLAMNAQAQHVCHKNIRPAVHNHKNVCQKSGYVRGHGTVFYQGKTIKGAHSISFRELGRGYAKDNFNVYYRGNVIKGASVNSFRVLKNGYAKDAFDAYYMGKKMKGVAVTSFRVMGDGYAKDAFNTYYKGKRIGR